MTKNMDDSVEDNDASSSSGSEDEFSEPETKKFKSDPAHNKPAKNKQKNGKKPAACKQPTLEEINEWKESQESYNNSNIFRQQVEETLKEVKIKNKHQTAFHNWFKQFKKFIVEDLPEFDPISLSSIGPLKTAAAKEKSSKKIADKKSMQKHQFIDELKNNFSQLGNCDQDINLKFVGPQEFDTFGLHKIEALPGPILQANINLTMPAECFHQKDYLNGRFLVRKRSYLRYIAHFLEQRDICGTLELVNYLNNDLWPILELTIKDSKKVLIRIFVTPPEGLFRAARFLPSLNNIKENPFDGCVIDSEILKNTPTPYYNSSLVRDVTLMQNWQNFESLLKDMQNVKEAIQLIKIWLNQRQLNVGLGCVSDEMITYFIAHLVNKKMINNYMSSYQVMRIFWNFIIQTDLTQNPLSICEQVDPEVLDSFKKVFEVVFLDKTGTYNVTSFMSKGFYEKLKHECGIAFKLLDDEGIRSFHSLFLTKLPVEIQYDLIISIQNQNQFKTIIDSATDEEKTTFLGHHQTLVIKKISDNLRKGLNKRATLIVPHSMKNGSCEKNELDNIHFGITLDPTSAFNIIEMGPEFRDVNEQDFRQFWGELCSDRRFRDGQACVAVHFESKTIKDKRQIIRKIIDWVLKKKLNLDYNLHYDCFEDLLVNKKVTTSFDMGTNEECCLKVIAAADELGKKLRNLNMALSITGVQGACDTYSFTEAFPPIPTNYQSGKKVTSMRNNHIILLETNNRLVPKYVKPIECVLQLEHSSKWPKTLEALRHMKTIFYKEVAELLAKKYQITSSIKPQFLDVFYQGFVFRYRLYLPKEVGLVKRQTASDGSVVYKDTPESKDMEKRLNVSPRITGALKGIQSQHPSYGPSTALIKRWLRSHLIDDFLFPDTVINLLNASLYVNDCCPFGTSSVPQVAFLRFLKFFSELRCEVEPVIVNFNDELPKERIAELNSALFHKNKRDEYPPLFIATPFDSCQSLFTKAAPTKEILRRVKQLSIEMLDQFHNIVLEQSHINIKSLFTANLDGYDVLIHLKPLLNPRRHEFVLSDQVMGQLKFEAFDPKKKDCPMPLIDCNPVQLYLEDLRDTFGDLACFFHDTYGGNVIGVIWKPQQLEPKDVKEPHVNGGELTNDRLVVKKEAIIKAMIEVFYDRGKDIVQSIDER